MTDQEKIISSQVWANKALEWMRPIRNWSSTKHHDGKAKLWLEGMEVLAKEPSTEEALRQLGRVLAEKEKRFPNGLAGDLHMLSQYSMNARWFMPWVHQLRASSSENEFNDTFDKMTEVFASLYSHAHSGKHVSTLWELTHDHDKQYADAWTRLARTRALKSEVNFISQEEKRRMEKDGHVWQNQPIKRVHQETRGHSMDWGRKTWLTLMSAVPWSSRHARERFYVMDWKDPDAVKVAIHDKTNSGLREDAPLFIFSLLASLTQSLTSNITAEGIRPHTDLPEWVEKKALRLALAWDKEMPNSTVAKNAWNHVVTVWPGAVLSSSCEFNTTMRWSDSALRSLAAWKDDPLLWTCINTRNPEMAEVFWSNHHLLMDAYKLTLKEPDGGIAICGKEGQKWIRHQVLTLKGGTDLELPNQWRRQKTDALSGKEWSVLAKAWFKATGPQLEGDSVLDNEVLLEWAEDASEDDDTRTLTTLCKWQPDFALFQWLEFKNGYDRRAIRIAERSRMAEKVSKIVENSSRFMEIAFRMMKTKHQAWEQAFENLGETVQVEVRTRIEHARLSKRHASLLSAAKARPLEVL